MSQTLAYLFSPKACSLSLSVNLPVFVQGFPPVLSIKKQLSKGGPRRTEDTLMLKLALLFIQIKFHIERQFK